MVAVVVAATGVAVVVASSRPEPRSAEEALAGAQAFLAETPSFRYEADVTESYGSPTDEGPGSYSSWREVVRAEVRGASEWHVTSDSGDWADEVIRVDDTVWTRSADSSDDLADETWMEFPVGEGAGDMLSGLVSPLGGPVPAMGSGLDDPETDPILVAQGLARDPATTVELIRSADAVEVLARDEGGMTIRLSPRLGDASAEGSLATELDVDADDIPTALRVTASRDDEQLSAKIAFSDWGADIAVSRPAPEDVDRTPWIDEEAVLAYAASGVYAPTYLPEGWSMTGLDVESAEDSLEGCEQLRLGYGVPFEVPEGFSEFLEDVGSGEELPMDEMQSWVDSSTFSAVDLALLDPACAAESALPDGLLDGSGFAGGHERREVHLGDTVVVIDAMGVDPVELDAIIGSLQPTDLASLVDAAAAIDNPGMFDFFGF